MLEQYKVAKGDKVFNLDVVDPSVRDKSKEYIRVCDGYSVITFWEEEILKVAQAGWKHKLEYHNNSEEDIKYFFEVENELADKFDSDYRMAKALANWINGPIMGWLNDNKIELVTKSKPSHHKSLVTGNLYDYEKYSNIDEEKWFIANNVSKKYLPLPAIEYPYTIVYTAEKNNLPIKIEHLIELIGLVEFTDLISFSVATKTVFVEMIKNPDERPWDIIERLNLIQDNDDHVIENLVKAALDKYPDKITEYRNGKKGVLSLFMGEVMKSGKGKINPKMANEMVTKFLEG